MVELGRSIDLEDTIEWIRVYIYGNPPKPKESEDKIVRPQRLSKLKKNSSDSEESEQERSESEDSNDEADEEELVKTERKRLRTVKRIWAKKRAKSVDLKLQRKAHTVDLSMMHRVESNLETTPSHRRYHHHQHQASTDEEEEAGPNFMDGSSMIKSEKVQSNP